MQEAARLDDETERLAALQRYDILDSAPEETYEQIVALAREACDAPMGGVSLVAEDRLWMKAEQGLGVREAPRGDSVCTRAIASADTVHVVGDTLEEPKLAKSSLTPEDGPVRFYAGSPIETPDGQRLGTVCVMDDAPRKNLSEEEVSALDALSDQVALLLELRRAGASAAEARDAVAEQVEELRRRNRELDRLAAVASHELQDHLAAIKGNLDVLATDEAGNLPSDVRERVRSAGKAAGEAGDLLAALRRYAVARAGDVQDDVVDLEEAADTALRTLEARRSRAGAAVDVGDLPQVRGDPQLVIQVLRNLLGNALEHAGPKPTVEVRARPRDEVVRVEVADDGPGIPAAERDGVVEPFRRGSTAGDGAGLGMGLALSREVVERLGGDLGIEESNAGGARVWFTLPRAADEPA